MQKSGKNLGSYQGEIIDIHSLLRNMETVARQHQWSISHFHEVQEFKLSVYHRPPLRVSAAPLKVYLSAGIHGDEPAAPLAAYELLLENQWPENLELFLVPCLNPVGYTVNRRHNADGIDLNRDYRQPKSAEVRAHIAWLEKQPKFDLYLLLHEDWESNGFYLYEQNPEGRTSFAERIISAVGTVCPIDEAPEIEGRPAQHGIIRPVVIPQERPDWPEALYLITHQSRQGYTLEAPSDFALRTRVNALKAAVQAIMKSL